MNVDPGTIHYNPTFGMTEMGWLLDNGLAVRYRADNDERVRELSVPVEDQIYLFPMLAVNMAIRSMLLWSCHCLIP